MKPLTRAESRDIDRYAIEKLGIPGIVLMENAGRGAAEVLLAQEPPPRKVLVLCGKGNNAGDGFVVARHLAIRGVDVRVALTPRNRFAQDSATNFHAARNIRILMREPMAATDLIAMLDDMATGVDWIVDAMLGTGASGEPREPYRAAIEWMNEQPARKLALDIPSGLDCDTGQPSAATVRADVTCTFHAPKIGFLQPSAAEFLGDLHVVSIGIPAV